MSDTILTDFVLTVGAVDLSDKCTQIKVREFYDEVEIKAVSGGTRRAAGNYDFEIQVTFVQDFAASEVHATLQPLNGSTAAITGKATSDATSATNPEFSGTVLVSEYTSFDGSGGGVSQVTATWKRSSGGAWATS